MNDDFSRPIGSIIGIPHRIYVAIDQNLMGSWVLSSEEPILVICAVPRVEQGFVGGFLKVNQLGYVVTIRHPDVATLTFLVVTVIPWGQRNSAASA